MTRKPTFIRHAKQTMQVALLVTCILGSIGIRDGDQRKLPLIILFTILGTAAITKNKE